MSDQVSLESICEFLEMNQSATAGDCIARILRRRGRDNLAASVEARENSIRHMMAANSGMNSSRLITIEDKQYMTGPTDELFTEDGRYIQVAQWVSTVQDGRCFVRVAGEMK